MQKQMGQRSFADELVSGAKNFLSDVDALVDWRPLERELSGIYDSPTGRPSYPLIVLFKILLLQQWYSLSDPGVEEAMQDRISFRRFVGLSLSDSVPDHSTISRFRSLLGNHYSGLLLVLNSQLESRGLMVKQGTLIDASFVGSSTRNPSLDPEAGIIWKRKGRPGFTGYKMHGAIDQQSGLVRRMIVTAANINETDVADRLVIGDEKAVYADKAYDTHARRRQLKARGIFPGIMHRPNKHHPLTSEQLLFNQRLTKLRAPVERVFGILKMHYQLRRTRYIGLVRTTIQITLAVIAINIKRGLKLATT